MCDSPSEDRSGHSFKFRVCKLGSVHRCDSPSSVRLGHQLKVRVCKLGSAARCDSPSSVRLPSLVVRVRVRAQ
jgi:hypothetical protein